MDEANIFRELMTVVEDNSYDAGMLFRKKWDEIIAKEFDGKAIYERIKTKNKSRIYRIFYQFPGFAENQRHCIGQDADMTKCFEQAKQKIADWKSNRDFGTHKGLL